MKSRFSKSWPILVISVLAALLSVALPDIVFYSADAYKEIEVAEVNRVGLFIVITMLLFLLLTLYRSFKTGAR